MGQLLTRPMAFAVASTIIDPVALDDWIDHNGLRGVAETGTSPLYAIDADDADDLDRLIEFAGRHCYRAWRQGRGRDEYIANLIEMKHTSVLEHASISFAIQGVSRSLTHELVRHRVGASPSQESQRYVAAEDINFVVPPLLLDLVNGDLSDPLITKFDADCHAALDAYSETLEAIKKRYGLKQEDSDTKEQTLQRKRALEAARSLLPNAAETRLTWTVNLRALPHFLSLRGGEGADLEIRRLAIHLYQLVLEDERTNTRVLDGFAIDTGSFGVPTLVC